MKHRMSVVGLVVAVLAVGVGVAFAMGLLLLPMDPVTVTHGPWLGGAFSTLDITLSDVPGGYDVTNGTYVGWCAEDNFLDDPPDGSQLRLVDSTDAPANFPDPCGNYDQIPWDLVNYLLNHKGPTATSWDVQIALWEVAGTASGVYNLSDYPIALAMVNDTNAHGTGFVPSLGEVVAVGICADGIDVNIGGGAYQDTLIEVPFDGLGCTPGYWRQPHHFDSWVGYGPHDSFLGVFGVGPDLELRTTVKAKGGGENALLRHATAALLNAASPDVDYFYTAAEVIAMVAGAYNTGDFETTKDVLAGLNETWCPLN